MDKMPDIHYMHDIDQNSTSFPVNDTKIPANDHIYDSDQKRP